MARFDRRVVIVTGGASGIGEATARAFAAEGARVVIADIDRERGQTVAREIDARFEPTDVGDEAEIARLLEGTAQSLGRIDVLVSNAFATAVGPIEKLTLEGWRLTQAVTLEAVFTGLRAVAPLMRQQGGGAVVNVASISGLGGDRGLAAYNAAKGAVINLTRTAALELAASGIRVNAVCPGVIDTPAVRRAFSVAPEREAPVCAAVPLRRLGRPEEVATAILFLASEEASYVTGATLVVDGGLTASTGIPDLVG
jgi:meso-butanediol dehydrogenase/(S,S)-butanediol dehydrogenase/diacetyl reductase